MSPEQETQLLAFLDRVRKPLAKGDPRRHHFIPQFFQKRFANNDDQLAVIPIQGGKNRVVHVSRIAVINDLYTSFDQELGETVAVERILAEADGEAAGAIGRLTADGFPPSPEDRATMAIWLGLLRVRDPHTRRTMEALADSVYKADLSLACDPMAARARLRDNLAREPSREEVADLVEAANDLDSIEVVPHQSDLVGAMLDMALFAVPHLLERMYTLLRFAEPGLMLSDRPFVLYQAPENRHPLRGVGLINADELWLPLDRSTALILHSEPMIGERVIAAPAFHGLDDFNQAVVLNAASEVYCHPDDVERLANLRLPDPNRPLMQRSGGDWIVGATDGLNMPPERRRHRRYRREG